MTDQELTQTYVGLLIIQYADPNEQPNAAATIALVAGEAIANQIVGQVGAGFALTAIYGQAVAQGAQLDVLAQFVGAERFLPTYSPTVAFFGMQDTTGSYNPAIGGYGDANSATPPADYWNSTSQPVDDGYTLSDAQLVQLIQYLAAANNAYFSVKDVDDILFAFFGVYVTVAESATMQITYTQDPSDPGTLFGIVEYLDAFPHPAGVQLITSP